MISIRGLTKRFGSLTAVDNLSLDIAQGEVFGFIGPNGAGKSTTMKILAGLLRPDSGRALVDGLDTATNASKVRRIIGYMPDFLGVYEDLSVDEYLQFFAAAYKTDRSRRRALIDSVLELTDLTAKKKALVDSLSRGMQQRLGVARVLIHEPKVLLLDEPASGLDPRARIEMRSLLTELGRMGKCVMVSSHILSELGEMCSSIGIVERGKLLYAGSVGEAVHLARDADLVAVRLEPPAPPFEALRDALLLEPRVRSVKEDDGSILVELAPDEAHSRHFLLELLLARGARVASFSPVEIGLEEAFLRLTKGKIQ